MARPSLSRPRAAFPFLLNALLIPYANAQDYSSIPSSITLNPPSSPPSGTQVINGTFQSFSIEFAYMADFAGNLSNPNLLSIRLLQNLATISGAVSYIRVGGSTANLPVYNPTQTTGVVNVFASPSADQPYKVTIGPSWYESLQTFPKGTQYVYDVNYSDDSTQGVQNTIDEAKRVFKTLGNNLISYELGNEVEGWAGKNRPAGWDAAEYVTDWVSYTTKIGPAVFGPNEFPTYEPRFQAGVFDPLGGPGFNPNKNKWNGQYILEQGIDSTKRVKTIGMHEYMGTRCGGESPSLTSHVMNHGRVAFVVEPQGEQAAWTISHYPDVGYVLGETNSISCQGEEGVSNVYGSALWTIDYQLYTATTLISRMYFHMGTPYRYSSWQPIPYLGLPAEARPVYYGNLFMAQLYQGGNKQVVIMTNTTYFTSYAIYTQGSLSDVAVVNFGLYSGGNRPNTKVMLSGLPAQLGEAKVRRLTAPGATVKSNITFAGRTVLSNGQLTDETVEALGADGSVMVGYSEAVLISW